MNRRGQKLQSGSPAAALIGIMTLMFIFYILFLPPSERKALLGDGNVTGDGGPEEVLLQSPVGRLQFVSRNQFDHPLPNIYLVETRNAQILAKENPFMIKKGWFSEAKRVFSFSIPDLENTENVILSFQAPERKGILVVTLNGVLIFESPVALQNPPPVGLSKSLLRESNTLEFSVKGGFLSRRKYSFADIKVIGDITDVEKQKSTNTFSVSSVEMNNFESAYLDFYPICEQRTVGTMTLELNGKLISSSVPACESLNRQDLFAEDLRSGKNTLLFKITKGSYRVEQLRVRTVLEPVKAFIDFFNVKSSVYNDILDKDREAMLLIEFVDDEKIKRAELNINGRKDMIDQRDYKYERDISTWIREGNNYIEIKPLTELDVVKLEVRVD